VYFAGVDIGSISAEAVIVDQAGKVLGQAIGFTGADSVAAAQRTLEQALADAGVKTDVLVKIISTGYGRERVPFAHDKVTEITCHARGARSLFPKTRTVIDIGGQDSKAIKVDDKGRVMAFQMNDKCAAGTGRFIEVMARALEVDLAEMGARSLQSDEKVSVSSVCTVFAESEVVGLIHQGRDKNDIIRGIHAAIADRTRALAGRVGIEPEITMTGGVAKNKGVVNELKDRLGLELNIPEEPQIVGALGAALIARDRGLNK
jgi:predicted CoA-substrate-specific enzyme activase